MERTLSGTIDNDGFPYITVGLGLDQSVPPVVTKAIIDTGASRSLLRVDLIKELKLSVIATAQYNHPLYGRQTGNFYSADILFDLYNHTLGIALLKGVVFGELIAKDYPSAVILGVDFLRNCDFDYDGINKKFSLHLKI